MDGVHHQCLSEQAHNVKDFCILNNVYIFWARTTVTNRTVSPISLKLDWYDISQTKVLP